MALVLTILIDAPLVFFIEITTWMAVWIIGLGTLVFAHGRKGLSCLWKATFSHVDDEWVDMTRDAVHTAGVAFINAGWLTAAINFIQAFYFFRFTRMKLVAYGCVFDAFLALFYAYAIAYLLWLPIERRMESRSLGA